MNKLLFRDDHIIFTPESELQTSTAKIHIALHELRLSDELKKELSTLLTLYEASIYINVINQTQARGSISDIPDTPGGLEQINKLNQFRRLFKKTLSSPIFILKKKLALARCLNKEDKFMEEKFSNSWKQIVTYIAYSTKALLFIYEFIIPNILSILKTIKHADSNIKKLIYYLENEKTNIEHAMLTRIKTGIDKEDLENDDVFYYVANEIAEKNETFKNQYEHVKKFGCFSAPEKKMTEDNWLAINQNLARTSDKTIQKKYADLWERPNNWQPIPLKVIKRDYGLVVIPSEIKPEWIPFNIPQISWLRPGIAKRCRFFVDNFYKITDLNLKITNLNKKFEHLNSTLTHQQILDFFQNIFLIENILLNLIIDAENNKFGGITRIFFKKTNNMLDGWKKSVVHLQKSVFFPLKEKFISHLKRHIPNINWDQITDEPDLLQELYEQQIQLKTNGVEPLPTVNVGHSDDTEQLIKTNNENSCLHQNKPTMGKNYREILLEKFKDCNITQIEVCKLWEILLLYDQAYMYVDENEENSNLVKECENFIAEFYAISAEKLSVFNFLLNVDDTNFDHFEMCLNDIFGISMIFQFFNTNPDCTGNLIDAILIKYVKCLSKTESVHYLMVKIEQVIMQFANSEQKEIFFRLKNGENIDNNTVKNMSENYCKTIFKMNSVKFINFLNSVKITKKVLPSLWEPAAEELPITLKKKIINKILFCQLNLCDKETLEPVNMTISKCWNAILEDLKTESKNIQKIVSRFILDNCVAFDINPNVAANSKTMALIVNGVTV